MGLPIYVRLLLVLAALLAAVIVGVTAGLLTRWEGARTPTCIRGGSAATGVALTLFLLVLTSLRALG
ncbi:hypothetical protein ACH4YO_29750 [Streptomyces noursei]|uniref:hypothetical protein n=1 Tax=Streptomyces noursei TaxID=1971 RepID=UPI00081CE9D0|nr:membrane protein [Streptomyces noursei ATCC 11455]MCZ0996253.1 hypothetical protein [Streptomyces noursei]